MKELINVKNVSFKYSKNYVLENISLNIGDNEVLGVLGHNGAGKATLFRLVMRLFKPNQGTIEFNDKNCKGFNFINYLPENNGIYENLSAY